MIVVDFDCFAISEQGADPDGNDDYVIAEPKAGIFIIADGMGGRPGGSRASSIAARSFYEQARGLGPIFGANRQQLVNAIARANSSVRAIVATEPMMSGLGTTLSAILLQESRGKIIHVGDSRVYLFRDDHLQQLTEDHTLVAALVDGNRITLDGAKRHPLRNVLVRCIGPRETVEPDILDLAVQTGDWLILATDGLAAVLDADSLRDVIEAQKAGSAEELCRAIMRAAQLNHPADNVTVITVHVVAAAHDPCG